MLYQDATETALNSAWNNNPAVRTLFEAREDFRTYLDGPRDAATERELQNGIKIATDIEHADLALEQFLKGSPELLEDFKDNFEPYEAFRRP